MPADRLPCTVCLSSLVLIAQVVFLLERGHRQTDRQTRTHEMTTAIDHPTNGLATANVGN